MSRIMALLCAFVLIALSVGPSRAQTELPLAIGEAVEIDVFARPELSGERVIDAAGRLAMPLVGRVDAAGKTAVELEDILTQRLRSTGLDSDPSVTVTVSKRLDIYVDGGVQNPGAFPWRPGLTVGQAIALAGGRIEVTDEELGPALNALRSIEYAAALQRRAEVAMVQQARIRSEVEFAAHAFGDTSDEAISADRFFSIPPTLSDRPELAVLIETQRSIFVHNIRAHLVQHASLKTQVELLTKRVELLHQRLGVLNEESEIITDRLRAFQQLSEKGLAKVSDVASLQRAASSTNGNLLEVVAAIADGEVALEQAKLARDSYGLNITRELKQELVQVQAELADVRSRLDPASRAGAIGVAYDRASGNATAPVLASTDLIESDKAETLADLQITRVGLQEPFIVSRGSQELVVPGDTITVITNP